MTTMEIRPRNGGAAAAEFAQQLATAIARHTNATMDSDGTTITLHRL